MTGLTARTIQEMVDQEAKAWDAKNPDLFLSIIHPDMANVNHGLAVVLTIKTKSQKRRLRRRARPDGWTEKKEE